MNHQNFKAACDAFSEMQSICLIVQKENEGAFNEETGVDLDRALMHVLQNLDDQGLMFDPLRCQIVFCGERLTRILKRYGYGKTQFWLSDIELIVQTIGGVLKILHETLKASPTAARCSVCNCLSGGAN